MVKKSKPAEVRHVNWDLEPSLDEAAAAACIEYNSKAEVMRWANTHVAIEPVSELDSIFNKRLVEMDSQADTGCREGCTGDLQECCIVKVCDQMRETLLHKNACYGGAAFRDVVLMGERIPAKEALKVRLSDKIRRLLDGKEFGSEDTLQDLAGYCLLVAALKEYEDRT